MNKKHLIPFFPAHQEADNQRVIKNTGIIGARLLAGTAALFPFELSSAPILAIMMDGCVRSCGGSTRTCQPCYLELKKAHRL
jgi:hypothetical protein